MSKNENKIKQDLAGLFRARFPYIYINSWEEERVTDILKSICKDEELIRHRRTVYIWSQTTGFINCDEGKSLPGKKDPIDALDFIKKADRNSLFILKDFHIYMEEPKRPMDYDVIRKMRDIIPSMTDRDIFVNVVILAPALRIPLELEKEITVYDFPLPNQDEMEESLSKLLTDNNIPVDPVLKERLSKSALGLTLKEAENAFSLALVSNQGKMNENAIQAIFDEKNQIIRKNGILEFVKSDLNLSDIGGLDNLKKWLLKRKGSWEEKSGRYNIPAPKGVLIIGIPGCGKSLTAKAMSAIWQLPLLKLDMGRIYNGIVGSSEANMRHALNTAEAVAPSILWIDEIEKGMAGHGSNGDSGTSTRILGTFLTWLQEKTAPVFVIATANDISELPPELLRKGRFDEIFFVDLPTVNERKEIFNIHLKKRVFNTPAGEKLTNAKDLAEHLAEITAGFTGAEIEQAVISALYDAFFEKRDVTEGDLETAVKNTIPLSVTQKEQIKSLRDWANIRAVSATSREDRQNYAFDSSSQSETESEHAAQSVEKSRGGRLLDV